jgi:transposase
MSRPLGTADELERRRRRAVELIDRGERPGVVARILGVDRTSVYRWRQAARRGGAALAAQPHPGRPPALTGAQLRQLEVLLRQGPQAHGWPNALWTCPRVAALIERRFGRSYHPDHVGRFLRQRLGWSVQKPVRRARERDAAAILDWQSRVFPRLARAAQDRGAHLVFLDESGFALTPSVRRTWAPRGRTPVLDAWDRRDRLSAISAITLSPKARRLNLYFDVLPDNVNVRGEDVVDFLRQLKTHVPGPLTVVWDGAGIHDRSRAVRAYLAKHPEIQTERLPAYAPELNPDELVWAWTKYSRLGNLAASNTDWLREYLINEFTFVQEHPELLASFVEATPLPLPL